MKNLLIRQILLITSVILLLAPTVTSAAVFVHNEVVEPTEPIDDDAFFAGERITVTQTIADDAYLAGGIVEIESAIGEDLMAAGNSVTLSAEVGDDAFLAGDRVVIENNSTMDDLFAAGRSLEVREGTTITGDAYLAGADIALNGSFEGTVRLTGESIEIGPTAIIAGDVIAHGPTAPTVADGATIRGTVRHVPANTDTNGRDGRSLLATWVRDVVILFITGLVLLYLAPRLSALVQERIYTTTLSSFAIGFLWLIAMIPAIILLLITLVGWPLAVIGMFLSGLLITGAALFMPLVVGTWLARKLDTRVKLPKSWQQVLLGAVVVASIHFIPTLGPLLLFVITLAIMGVMIRILKQTA